MLYLVEPKMRSTQLQDGCALTTNSMSTPHMSSRLTISLQTGNSDARVQHKG
jgi:hypothetical protein